MIDYNSILMFEKCRQRVFAGENKPWLCNLWNIKETKYACKDFFFN